MSRFGPSKADRPISSRAFSPPDRFFAGVFIFSVVRPNWAKMKEMRLSMRMTRRIEYSTSYAVTGLPGLRSHETLSGQLSAS